MALLDDVAAIAKVAGATRADLILAAEIMVISLAEVTMPSFWARRSF